jgi:hypothetical protein
MKVIVSTAPLERILLGLKTRRLDGFIAKNTNITYPDVNLRTPMLVF